MTHDELRAHINDAWNERDTLNPDTTGPMRDAVETAIELLDAGSLRCAARNEAGEWKPIGWVKQAVVLSFALNPTDIISDGPGGSSWWDKVPSKFDGWGETEFKAAGFRAVPDCVVRKGAYVGPRAVLMPSFVNIGARVGEGTMVDTFASIGSCAQVGRNCHISAGTGIGGVLEPLQASPTVVEDNCFIGARSEVVEGVVVREGSVLAMGVFISQSTKIYNRDTGEVSFGEVPPYSVVVPGSLPSEDGSHSLACAVIVKTVDERTRGKTAINELLRI